MTNPVSDEIVLHIIEKGLSSLGENPKEAIWFCLEKDFNLNRQNTTESIEEFQKALQKLFGVASGFVDVLLRNYLGEATGEDLSKCSSFADCVITLRKKQSAESIEVATDTLISSSRLTE